MSKRQLKDHFLWIRYVNSITKISAMMNDQLNRPLDVAVYWIEYVIRHGGADHLRTSAYGLSLFQRVMLDVIVLSGLVIFILSFLIVRLVRFFCCLQLRRNPALDPVKKKK